MSQPVTRVCACAALAPLIAQHSVPESLLAKGFRNMFSSLAMSILSQQLAVRAASVIQGRFLELCKVSTLRYHLCCASHTHCPSCLLGVQHLTRATCECAAATSNWAGCCMRMLAMLACYACHKVYRLPCEHCWRQGLSVLARDIACCILGSQSIAEHACARIRPPHLYDAHVQSTA